MCQKASHRYILEQNREKPQKCMYRTRNISMSQSTALFSGSFSPIHPALAENPEIFNADVSHCGSNFTLKSPALFPGSICSIMVDPGLPCLYMLPVPHQVDKTGTVSIFIFGNFFFLQLSTSWYLWIETESCTLPFLVNQLDREVNRNNLTSFSVFRHRDLEICLLKSSAGLNVCRETSWANLFHFCPTQSPVAKLLN